MKLKSNIITIIHPGKEQGYVAECLDIAVVTQGRTLDEVVNNLKEAVALHLEDENLNKLGFIDHPILAVTVELKPEYA